MSRTGLLSRQAGLAVLLALAWAVAVRPAGARYLKPDLVDIPVERLTANLEELAKKDPKDVAARFNLARAHAMAYALKTDTAQVRKGKEGEGAWFGYEPAHVPFAAQPTEDKDKLKTAREHLAQALARYEEVLRLDPDNLPAALGHAWCLEQAGDKAKAVQEYCKVIDAGWEKEKGLKEAPLGWHSVTAEAAGNLIPLLDPDKDKAEIRTLQERIKQMQAVPRPVTPIVVPLRDGLTARDLEDRSASVTFDVDGSGSPQRWSWVTKDAGWLVYDPHGTGRVTSGLQLFGGVTFWMFWDNGYEALAALDDDRDGVLTGRELEGLAIWQDRNGNGVCDAGEVRPLAAWGIVAVSCRCRRDPDDPSRMAYAPQGVRFRDGSTRPTYDLILRRR
jgi:hypothetical protein